MKRFPTRRGSGRQTATRLSFQALETRKLMAADIGLFDGVVSLEGTDADDAAEIYAEDGAVIFKLTSFDGDGNVASESIQSFAQEEVKRVVFDAGAGDDILVNDSDVPVIARGGSGDDVLMGGGGNDVLLGGSGDDLVLDNGQNRILAGIGEDVVIDQSDDLTPDGLTADESVEDESPQTEAGSELHDGECVDESTSVADDPVSEESIAEDPVAQDSVGEDPVAEDPVAEDPAIEDSLAEDSTTTDSITEEPDAENVVADDLPVAEVGPANAEDDLVNVEDDLLSVNDSSEDRADCMLPATDTNDLSPENDLPVAQPIDQAPMVVAEFEFIATIGIGESAEVDMSVAMSEPDAVMTPDTTPEVTALESVNDVDAEDPMMSPEEITTIDPLPESINTGGEQSGIDSETEADLDSTLTEQPNVNVESDAPVGAATTTDHDMIFGGAGDDWLFGGGGDDFIFGNMSPLEDELLRGVISGRFAI